MVEELQQGIDAAVRPADAQRYSQSVVEHANRVKRTKAELLASSQSAQAHLCKTAQVHAPEAAVILTSASGLGRVPFCGLAQTWRTVARRQGAQQHPRPAATPPCA
ncbi:hypothetical protein CHLRE_17g724873v5 [Chlamydomonas reinhardtii]|uniref:Uncharacterized protein n=1 Tax=Chlamydomonas reinhardtii TaxID=3055 RepID=A0A2K3CQJ4_CHLRE|nr:uncharacterized protein CHLRE_17g724873v5 [Chlamydomonas reinhardtii]PNW70557.1 hypothetical protein CHLRE_17g724873v5 [Chlamydomonas reinhardtii]